MKRVLFPLLLVAAALPALCAELVVLATSDLHGELHRFAALAPVIRAEREALRIDVGDLATGNFEADHADGASMIEALNDLDYDFFVPGNHDFEFGAQTLADWRGAFRGCMLGAEWRTANWRPEPWRLMERSGVRCAVIGLSEPRMMQRTLPGDPVFEDFDAALARIMPQVRAAKPDVVILAWHRGVNAKAGRLDRCLKHYPEIDLVIGAHSHEENPGERVGGVYFVQAGCRAGAAVRLRLFVDNRSRKLERIESELLRPDLRRPDARIAAIADRYDIAARAAGSVVLLPRRGRILHTPGAGERGNELLAIGTAALLEAAGSDAALYTLPVTNRRGDDPLTRAGLFRLLPYRNRICAVTLTPGELRSVLEELERKERDGVSIHALRFARKTGETLTVAMTDYLLYSCAALQPVREHPERIRVSGTLERDAVAEHMTRSNL